MSVSTPNWVKHAIFYQIFPDSFARKVPDDQAYLLNLPLQDWEARPNVQRYKGGNLWGIIDQLDYLQDLGITALYLNPIFQSACNHRYHTHDYYQIDPMLGGEIAFRQLLRAAHDRQIKVILDGVFNHASRGFLFFNDILEQGPHSPWLDWFKVQGWPVSAYDGSLPANYDCWFNNRALPQFNHDNPATREYLMRVAEYWLRQGIDGWRLDVPNCITATGFWQEFRQRVKGINPDAYIVGEIFDDASQWLGGDQFDGVMNYPFARATIAFAAKDRVVAQHTTPGFNPRPGLDAMGYGQAINGLLQRHAWEIQLTQLNLLDSHDVARMITMVGHDRTSVELAVLLLFTFPGSPSIFYGDEVGVPGGHEPDCRRGFPTGDRWDQAILSLYRTLIQLRHRHAPLRTGSYQTLYAQGQTYVFARGLQQAAIVVAINSGPEPVQVQIRPDGVVWPCLGAVPGSPSVFSLRPQDHYYGRGAAQWQGEGDDCCLVLQVPTRTGLVLGNQSY
jgi:neopullulanase